MAIEKHERKIAYFSMEIGLQANIPTYSGGLGILAGDTIKSAADLNVPMVAITLLNRHGYFTQHIDEIGNQRETPAQWNIGSELEKLPARVSIQIEDRIVQIGVWKKKVI